MRTAFLLLTLSMLASCASSPDRGLASIEYELNCGTFQPVGDEDFLLMAGGRKLKFNYATIRSVPPENMAQVELDRPRKRDQIVAAHPEEFGRGGILGFFDHRKLKTDEMEPAVYPAEDYYNAGQPICVWGTVDEPAPTGEPEFGVVEYYIDRARASRWEP